LRDYQVDGQLGLEPDFEVYLEKLVAVFEEVRRVLRDDGTCWVNMGDGYAHDGAGTQGKNGDRATRTFTAVGAGGRGHGVKPKDLIGQPWRLAFALRDAGWYLRSEIIWHKPNPMPESVEDRPTKSHEQVFLLSKRARYFYDADAVREPAVDDEATFYAKIIKKDHKATLDDPGLNGLHRTKAGFKHATYNPAGRSLRSVWSIPSAPFAEAHFATFPPALVIPCIKAGTSERGACPECGAPWVRMVEASGGTIGKGAWQPEDFRDSRMTKPSNDGTYSRKDLGFRPACDHGLEPRPCEVLDPFAGACTTLLVADRLGRDATGIELNPAYAEMGRKRIVNDCPLFASVAVGPSDRQAIEPTKETP
jgi:DNA modification methylase